jgi:hypothetical protein
MHFESTLRIAASTAVKAGAEELGMPAMPIISGAGHDACYMSRVAPTGMIFIPCEDGISNNEIENATCEDCGSDATSCGRWWSAPMVCRQAAAALSSNPGN